MLFLRTTHWLEMIREVSLSTVAQNNLLGRYLCRYLFMQSQNTYRQRPTTFHVNKNTRKQDGEWDMGTHSSGAVLLYNNNLKRASWSVLCRVQRSNNSMYKANIYIFFYINQNTTEVTCIQDLQTSIPICFYFGRKQMYLKHEIYTFWVQQQIQSVNLFFLRISTSASHWRFPRSPESFLSDLFWSPGSDWEQKNSLLPQWLADAAPGSPSGLDAGR